MPNTPIIRPVERADAPGCGRVIFESFATVADGHGFDRDFPSAEAATGFVDMLLATSTARGFLAESDDRIVGCNFIDLAEPVAGVGPLAIDPAVQSNGLGRTLMEAVIAEATAAGFESIRFMQSAYNNVSMALYSKLGFRVCATAAVMGAASMTDFPSGYRAEPAGEADATRCGELCHRVLGFRRDGDFRAAVHAGSAMLAIRDGELVGYTTGIGFGGHSVALDNESLKALVAAAPSLPGPGFLVPMDNYDLLSWCLSRGSKIVMQMNLMCKGFYDRPSGAWMPSVLR